MEAKREHEKALAEDPTVFDYDAIYDELQAKKTEKVAGAKAADKEKRVNFCNVCVFLLVSQLNALFASTS